MQKKVISEMNLSVEMLRYSGEIPCDLDLFWVPDGEVEQQGAIAPAIHGAAGCVQSDDSCSEDYAASGECTRLEPSSEAEGTEEAADGSHSRQELYSLGVRKRRGRGAHDKAPFPSRPGPSFSSLRMMCHSL